MESGLLDKVVVISGAGACGAREFGHLVGLDY